jgi:enoyl-CoA hydratase/carnithine racemase
LEIILSNENFVIVEEHGHAGLITLNRPKALNALSMGMIRDITAALLKWKDAAHIQLVAIRGMGKAADGLFQPFGSFCAGGDIRFFHHAAIAGDPALEDFFTEEYSLNHLIHTYPKPYVVFMDGINMGGGMGISGHGGANSIRIASERLKMAMPETMIGLFPDAGGGWFLSRCPDFVGEYLALTGVMIGDVQAVVYGLASHSLYASSFPELWNTLCSASFKNGQEVHRFMRDDFTRRMKLGTENNEPGFMWRMEEFRQVDSQQRDQINSHFSKNTLTDILHSLDVDTSTWAQHTAAALHKRSPLMLALTLELIRRARTMSLADELRLERDLVRHCFHTKHLHRSGAATETVEGIRALAVDKDHAPKWNPARIEDVTQEMVQPFFESPWPQEAHPLRALSS